MTIVSNSVRTAMLATALSVGALGFAAPSFAQDPVTVGGAPMYANKNIVENAVNSKDHETLVAAVKAAGLVETLQGDGPFTVFAPTDDAFAALPAGTVETLVKPENKETLTGILTYHVVAGKLSGEELMKRGTTNLTTVSGDALTAQMDGSDLVITDETGKSAKVTIADVNQSNGVIHVVDRVLMPKS